MAPLGTTSPRRPHCRARTSRGVAAGVLAIALLASPVAARAAESDALGGPIVLHDRAPLAFLLTTPTGEAATTSSSDLIRIVSSRIEAHTSYFLQVTDPQVATDCRGRLGCVVQQLRAPYPAFLLVIANLSLEGQADRLSAMLVDVEAARALASTVRSDDDPDTLLRVEARIKEQAVLLGPERGQVKDAAETEAFVERLLTEQLARVFRNNETWEPYGAVQLTGVPDGVAITLDGVQVGVTRAGSTELRNVLSGARRITLERPGWEPWTDSVQVLRGETVSVTATLRRSGSRLAAGARTALFWGGSAAALGGAVITGLAIARHDAEVTPVCIAALGTTCRTSASFETLGYDPHAGLGDTINPSGIRAAPLGYSLLGLGATWALGTWLFGTEEDLPWVQLLAGLAVGTVAYGVSSALDGSSPSR